LVLLVCRSLQQQVPPGATLHCWRLQVLVGNSTSSPSGWRQAELEADVRRVLQPVVVVSSSVTHWAAYGRMSINFTKVTNTMTAGCLQNDCCLQ
jgi:hypothetical protein